MRLRYYPETDSAYVEFSKSPGTETREVADGLNVDLGADGQLIGLEIERASKHLEPSAIQAYMTRDRKVASAPGVSNSAAPRQE